MYFDSRVYEDPVWQVGLIKVVKRVGTVDISGIMKDEGMVDFR